MPNKIPISDQQIRDILILKKNNHCLHEIQIELGNLYFIYQSQSGALFARPCQSY